MYLLKVLRIQTIDIINIINVMPVPLLLTGIFIVVMETEDNTEADN